MPNKLFAVAGAVGVFAVGLAAGGVIPGLADTIATTTQVGSSLTTGGSASDFAYEGQTVSHTKYGQPWESAPAAQSGWVQTPLSLNCEPGTLALMGKVLQTGDTVTFTPPAGSVIVGVLWKSGQNAKVTGATWAGDGSSATVTLNKAFGASRTFYCMPTPIAASTPEPSNPEP